MSVGMDGLSSGAGSAGAHRFARGRHRQRRVAATNQCAKGWLQSSGRPLMAGACQPCSERKPVPLFCKFSRVQVALQVAAVSLSQISFHPVLPPEFRPENTGIQAATTADEAPSRHANTRIPAGLAENTGILTGSTPEP